MLDGLEALKVPGDIATVVVDDPASGMIG